ncbi:MAG: hypothetical protein QXI97_01305 [Nitrososphaerota archaeon]
MTTVPKMVYKPLGREGSRGPYLPRELRIKLYDEVRRLRGRGLSYNRIVEAVRERYGVWLSKSSISEWVRGLHSPLNGIRIPSVEFLKPSKELAYVIGVVAGDGYVKRRQRPRKSCHETFIGLKVVDMEFAEEFARCLATVVGREPPEPRWDKRRFVVEIWCRTLYRLLRKPIDIERLRPFVELSGIVNLSFLERPMAWDVARLFMHVFDYIVDCMSRLFRLHNYSPFDKAYASLLFIAGLSLRDVSRRYCLTHASRESVREWSHRLKSVFKPGRKDRKL